MMFIYAPTFNRDISEWDVSAVTDMTGMFQTAYAFNQDLGDWCDSAAVKKYYFSLDSGCDVADCGLDGILTGDC